MSAEKVTAPPVGLVPGTSSASEGVGRINREEGSHLGAVVAHIGTHKDGETVA